MSITTTRHDLLRRGLAVEAALIGLSANAAFGWSWADLLSALVIVPFVVREGIEGLRGRACCAH